MQLLLLAIQVDSHSGQQPCVTLVILALLSYTSNKGRLLIMTAVMDLSHAHVSTRGQYSYFRFRHTERNYGAVNIKSSRAPPTFLAYASC